MPIIVNQGRARHGIDYPALYAAEGQAGAREFNCVQRGASRIAPLLFLRVRSSPAVNTGASSHQGTAPSVPPANVVCRRRVKKPF